MMKVLILVTVYLLVLNIVVSIRIFRSAEERYRKVIFFVLVWMLPLLGAVFVASLLNAVAYKPRGWWLKHLVITRLLASLFMIKIAHPKSFAGYPGSENDYGWYNGAWDGGSCDGWADGGACGGDGSGD